MRDFQFHRPSTVAQAKQLLRARKRASSSAVVRFLPVLKLDMAQPSDLISLAGVTELRAFAATVSRMGPLPPMPRSQHLWMSQNPGLAKACRRNWRSTGRNRGTLGDRWPADPAADYPAAILGLSATISTRQANHRCRRFFTGLFEDGTEPDEIIVSVRFPIPERSAYGKFASHASRYAVVGVMVAKFASGVRVGVTGAGPSAFRWKDAEAALTARFRPTRSVDLPTQSDELTSTPGRALNIAPT